MGKEIKCKTCGRLIKRRGLPLHKKFCNGEGKKKDNRPVKDSDFEVEHSGFEGMVEERQNMEQTETAMEDNDEQPKNGNAALLVDRLDEGKVQDGDTAMQEGEHDQEQLEDGDTAMPTALSDENQPVQESVPQHVEESVSQNCLIPESVPRDGNEESLFRNVGVQTSAITPEENQLSIEFFSEIKALKDVYSSLPLAESLPSGPPQVGMSWDSKYSPMTYAKKLQQAGVEHIICVCNKKLRSSSGASFRSHVLNTGCSPEPLNWKEEYDVPIQRRNKKQDLAAVDLSSAVGSSSDTTATGLSADSTAADRSASPDLSAAASFSNHLAPAVLSAKKKTQEKKGVRYKLHKHVKVRDFKSIKKLKFPPVKLGLKVNKRRSRDKRDRIKITRLIKRCRSRTRGGRGRDSEEEKDGVPSRRQSINVSEYSVASGGRGFGMPTKKLRT